MKTIILLLFSLVSFGQELINMSTTLEHRIPNNNIYGETHYDTVSVDILYKINRSLKNRVYYHEGYEVFQTWKHYELDMYDKVVDQYYTTKSHIKYLTSDKKEIPTHWEILNKIY